MTAARKYVTAATGWGAAALTTTLAMPALLAVTLLGVAVPAALAQMPPDEQFIRDIRDRNYAESMPYLVNGGNPNAREFKGSPALLVAAEVNDAAMVRSLLEYGANPNIAHRETGETALMRGATKGNEDIIRLLVFFKADLDAPDESGETALIKAVRGSHAGVVRLLLDGGADPALADYTGQTPYDHARRGRSRQIVTILQDAGTGN